MKIVENGTYEKVMTVLCVTIVSIAVTISVLLTQKNNLLEKSISEYRAEILYLNNDIVSRDKTITSLEEKLERRSYHEKLLEDLGK